MSQRSFYNEPRVIFRCAPGCHLAMAPVSCCDGLGLGPGVHFAMTSGSFYDDLVVIVRLPGPDFAMTPGPPCTGPEMILQWA